VYIRLDLVQLKSGYVKWYLVTTFDGMVLFSGGIQAISYDKKMQTPTANVDFR